LIIGYSVMAGAGLFNLGLNLALPPALPWSVMPLFGYTLGMSLAMPCLTLMALDPFAGERGLAASCQTFFQSGFNSLAAALIAPALWGSTITLALGMISLMSLGALATIAHARSRLIPR
jgi:DHA1 family bicyclomycin/chloramphenicol resistance-like MFS transporter